MSNASLIFVLLLSSRMYLLTKVFSINVERYTLLPLFGPVIPKARPSTSLCSNLRICSLQRPHKASLYCTLRCSLSFSVVMTKKTFTTCDCSQKTLGNLKYLQPQKIVFNDEIQDPPRQTVLGLGCCQC
jgi:hypothetical protein